MTTVATRVTSEWVGVQFVGRVEPTPRTFRGFMLLFLAGYIAQAVEGHRVFVQYVRLIELCKSCLEQWCGG